MVNAISFDMIIELVNKKIRKENLPKNYKADVNFYFDSKLKFLKREKEMHKIPSWEWFQDLLDAWDVSSNYLEVNLKGYEKSMKHVKNFVRIVDEEFKKMRGELIES